MEFGIRSIVLIVASAALVACGQNQSGENLESNSKGSNEQAPFSWGEVTGIIGGQNVNANDPIARSVVAIYDVQYKALCTASIVSSRYLITAAHCVHPGSTSNLRVVYGADMTNKASIVAVGMVTGAVQSPLWATNQNKASDTGDIAVVRLASPPPAVYVPATILNDNSALQAGKQVLLEGYGTSVGHPDAKSINDNGAGVLRAVVTKIISPNYSQTEVMIDESQGKGSCHGDSGGPAYIQVGGKTVLFGVTSRGTDQFCSKSVIYTNILAYAKWFPTAVQQLEGQVQKLASSMMPRFVANLQEQLLTFSVFTQGAEQAPVFLGGLTLKKLISLAILFPLFIGCKTAHKSESLKIPAFILPAGLEDISYHAKKNCKAFDANGGKTSISGDFDGDGIVDHAKIVKKKENGQEFLYVWLSSQEYKGIELDEIGDLEALNNMSLSLGKHGTQIQDACGRGNEVLCEENDPKEIVFKNDFIWYTQCEAAASIFYWNPQIKAFKRVWYSD